MNIAKTVRFEELYAAPSRNGVYKPASFHGSGVKIVNMGELFACDFIGPQEMNRLRLSDAEIEVAGLRDGDLLFGRRSLVESGAGKCSLVLGLVEQTTFESSLIRVRVKQEEVNPTFLYYWFRSSGGRGAIKAIVTGTNVKGIRGSDLKNVLVPLPERCVQERIADILRTFEIQKENCLRRIKLMEEAARLIYREWFVHLRFPGYERTKIENGVPEGWVRESLLDLSYVMSGGTPKTDNPRYWDGEIPFFTPKDTGATILVMDTEKHLTEDGLRKCNSQLYPPRTVFITARGTVGKVRMPLVPMAMNQSNYALSGKGDVPQEYLFFTVENSVSAFKSQAAGAVFDAIVVDTFKNIQVLKPAKWLLDDFVRVSSPIIDQIGVLMKQTSQLQAARDLLLPRLMSGEIEV